jgi:PKD repeat protein
MSYHAQKRIGRAIFETLEDRRLLSSVTFADGVLTIAGDLLAPNTLAINVTHNGTRVWGIANGVGHSVSIHDVTMIQVVGGHGDDVITIDPKVADLVWVQGHGGNDTIRHTRGGANSPQPPTLPPVVDPVPSDPNPDPDAPTDPTPQPPQDDLAPQPVIQVLNGTRIAGNAVHVHALETLLKSGTSISARYDWDFGNPQGRYNNLSGFNAAHVYEQPGTYTITLRVTDEAGRQGITTAEVMVAADTRRTIYVDNRGSTSNSGLSPTQAVPLSRAMELMGNDTRMLLHRGQIFTVSNTLNLPYSNILVGAYGTGTNPVLFSTSDRDHSAVITLSAIQSKDVVIQNLTFDSKHTAQPDGTANKIPALGIWARGQNITVRDSIFLNLNDGINANLAPTGLLIMDNQAPLATGIRSYFIWGEGRDHVYLGNTVANSTREHAIRMNNYQRVLIAHNDLTNLSRTSTDPHDTAKTPLWTMNGRDLYIAGNTFSSGQVRIGPEAGINPLSGRTGANHHRTTNVMFEQNLLNNSNLHLTHGVENGMIRDNVIHRRGGGAVVRIDGYDADYQRQVVNVTIHGNVATNTHTAGNFIGLGGAAKDLVVSHNLYVAPSLHFGTAGNGGIVSLDSDLSSFALIRNNTWSLPGRFEDATHYVWNKWWGDGIVIASADWSHWGDQFRPDITLDNISQWTPNAPLLTSPSTGAGTGVNPAPSTRTPSAPTGGKVVATTLPAVSGAQSMLWRGIGEEEPESEGLLKAIYQMNGDGVTAGILVAA